jgi:hypothetical protein
MRSKFNEIDVLSKQNETRRLYMAVTKINKGQTNHRQLDAKIKVEF